MQGIHIHIMERGIKGVRLIKNLYARRLDSDWAKWYILGNMEWGVSYGTLEVTQDITDPQKITGEKRLLDEG